MPPPLFDPVLRRDQFLHSPARLVPQRGATFLPHFVEFPISDGRERAVGPGASPPHFSNGYSFDKSSGLMNIWVSLVASRTAFTFSGVTTEALLPQVLRT